MSGFAPLPEGVMTQRQAAHFCGIGLTKFRELVARRKIRCLRPTPGRLLFRKVDLEAYLSKTANLLQP